MEYFFLNYKGGGGPGKMNDSYPVYKVEFRSRDILFTSGSLNKKASRQTKTIFR